MSAADLPGHVYIDTQYLHAYLFPSSTRRDDEEYIAKKEVEKVLHNRNPNILLKIPFVVVGEAVNNIHRKPLSESDKSDIIRRLLNMMGIKKMSFCPPTSSCFELSNQLLKADTHLDNTDTLIAAHALCDPLSTHFLVKDGAIVDSPHIQSANSDYYKVGKRHRLLKITPDF